MDDKKSRAAGHELKEANSRGIFWFGVFMVLFALVVHLSLGSMFFSLRKKEADRAFPNVELKLIQSREAPPPPRLQANPQADLEAYLAKERTHLSTYGWVDRKQDRVRIPISRAMELMAQQGAVRNGGSHE